MNIKKTISIMIIMSLMLAGCGQKEYYTAVQKQNEAIYQMNKIDREKERLDEQKHQEKMAIIMQQSLTAAAKTPDITDDILLPVLFMNMENQRSMVKMLASKDSKPMQLQPIKAPDSFGDNVRKSTGMVLGIGGLILGITQSNNMKDIAVSGMNAAGTHVTTGDNSNVYSDSYKNTGNDTGDINIATQETQIPTEEEATVESE